MCTGAENSLRKVQIVGQYCFFEYIYISIIIVHLKPVLALKNKCSAFIYRNCSPIHFISVSDVIKSMVEVTQGNHIWTFVCLFKKMHIYQRDSLLKCASGEINQCWFLKVRSVIWVFKACAVFIIIKNSS